MLLWDVPKGSPIPLNTHRALHCSCFSAAVWGLWYGTSYGGGTVLLLSTLSVALISIGYVYPQLYGKLTTVGLYTLLGACFAIYTDTRYDALTIPAGETLYSTDVTIHHPVTSSQSSHPRYSGRTSTTTAKNLHTAHATTGRHYSVRGDVRWSSTCYCRHHRYL